MGSVANKYRVHEVAKDFGIATKDITEILTKYAETPKNHMQVLEDRELSLIFEYLTQHNQIASIATVFAEGAKTEEKKPEPKKQPQQNDKPQAQKQGNPQPKNNQPNANNNSNSSNNNNNNQPQKPMSRVPQKQVVDTRKATNVNLDKYDEKLQDMADRTSGNRGRRDKDQLQGKEKFRNSKQRQNGPMTNKRKQEEADRMRKLRLEIIKNTPVTVQIPDEISVGELASRMKKTGAEVVKCLMKNGVMASLSQMIDFDTAAIIAEEMGCKVEKEVVVTIEEKLIDDHQDKEEDLVPRAPVVVVMGHVDHGKTSLLDYIRNAHVASGEAGGITQHIGAYQVEIHGKPITFLDTPGHEAFTSMRARGAMVTDIAILVVAAEDGIMPQTVESINHAKAAEIPIIVAINKMDKPEANPDRIKQQLTEYGLVCEEWGGDTIVAKVSAKTRQGLDDLLELVALQSEIMDLKANPNKPAHGRIVEAKLDKGRGPVATVLIQEGTLHQGDNFVCGQFSGRVRALMNDQGKKVKEAGPSIPVEVQGFEGVPEAGEEFFAAADEKLARRIAEMRATKQRERDLASESKVTLETFLSRRASDQETLTLNLVLKADVQGSLEAITEALNKQSTEKVRINVVHGGTGAISESDIMLASASQAIIIGFNVRPTSRIKDIAERENVDIRFYDIIYKLVDDIKSAMAGLLAPVQREVYLGQAEVRNTFSVPKVGIIAGSYVADGKIARNAGVRLLRDGVVVYTGKISSLKRFKDDAREVVKGNECGVGLENFNDVKIGDIIEAFETVEEAATP